MSKKKYYAVRVGRVPGIYLTWDECSKQVNSFKGAKYKSFLDIQEARDFIEEINVEVIKSQPYETKKTSNSEQIKPIRSQARVKVSKSYIDPKLIIEEYDFVAFVDGSYDRGNQVYGSGVVCLNPNDNSHSCYYDAGYDKWNQWNIVGELESVKVAINKAIELKRKNIAIYHDLKNISLWASGEWQAKNEYTQEYVRYIEDVSQECNIFFIKVKAHSNESKYNDLADEAAKTAIEKYLELKK